MTSGVIGAGGASIFGGPMSRPPPARDPERLLATLVVQLESARRAFYLGNAAWAAGNLVLVAFVWGRGMERPEAWIPAAIAFLANVFYALTAEWELRWEALWRREIPRLERELGDVALFAGGTDRGARRLGALLRWIHWLVSAGWLLVLLLAIDRSGLLG